MTEYEQMLAARRAAVRTLADDVVRGFIALSDEDRRAVAVRLREHFDRLHPNAPRWSLESR